MHGRSGLKEQLPGFAGNFNEFYRCGRVKRIRLFPRFRRLDPELIGQAVGRIEQKIGLGHPFLPVEIHAGNLLCIEVGPVGLQTHFAFYGALAFQAEGF